MIVLFRVAAGPRIGFGHLRRALTLASALGVAPRVSLRAGEAARKAAARLGAGVVQGTAGTALDQLRPHLLVIDDPVAAHARPWLGAARRRGIPVASVHDLGIAWIDSDLLVDGAFTHRREDGPRRLLGPRYMPCALPETQNTQNTQNTQKARGRRPGTGGGDRSAAVVLIALGGGPRRRHALRIARAIRRRMPRAEVRIAGGFASGGAAEPGIVWLPALPTLAGALRAATVAVVAGGVTLYEACALGVPAVAVAVSRVSAQRQTVRAGAARGVVVDAGALDDPGAPEAVAEQVLGLASDRKRRGTLTAAARRTVDGRGAARVATHLRRLARNRQ